MKLLSGWFARGKVPQGEKPVQDSLIAKSGKELLFPNQRLLGQIRNQVSIPDAHWQQLYFAFIEHFAAQVQELPASESYHHAQHGGLLLHSLEVGKHALKIRAANMLPLGASPEVIAEKQELWSYAIFTAAMLHDIGKPLVDQVISIHGENETYRWQPFSGCMPTGSAYSITFCKGRKYHLHESLPPLLATQIIPQAGMNWLASDLEVFEVWLNAISGKKHEAGVIGEIIIKADQVSVSESLTGTEVTTLPKSRPAPLHERLFTALKYLLDNDQLPLNRKGAAGWTADGKLWLVSKRVLDEIRNHLLEQGQSGIPSDNTRLMDELLQHGYLEANPDGRAIWKAKIRVEDWEKELTCLCVPLVKVWADNADWPTVSKIDVTSPTDGEQHEATQEQDYEDKKANPTIEGSPTKQQHQKRNPLSKHDDEDSANIDKADPLATPTSNKIDNSQNPHIFQKEAGQTESNHSKIAATFIDWLSSGISDGSLPVNQIGAAIHTVEEGLLLVSPAIFRNYAKIQGEVDYKQVQHAFQSLGINKITEENTNVLTYMVRGKRKKASCLKGMVVPDPTSALDIRLPPPNPVLSLEISE